PRRADGGPNFPLGRASRRYTPRVPIPLSHPPQRPPDFVWFIYGSSLDRDSFLPWAREHGYAVPGFERGFAARLDGFRLAFEVASRYWNGAVGSLAPAAGSHVEGLALPLAGSLRSLADHKEGAQTGLYVATDVLVAPLGGGPPTPAVAYVASPDRRLPEEGRPAALWLEAVIRGARAAGLSEAWLTALERLRGPAAP
ncbi:MAG TPA: gamma-glutamylcyclotransferase family protein, partial [Anaeromyxobacteraceae bacterium]|nr:gamma-glutamylcyclotransferase family protein [Anaeromyxobacteraceae bacterium]